MFEQLVPHNIADTSHGDRRMDHVRILDGYFQKCTFAQEVHILPVVCIRFVDNSFRFQHTTEFSTHRAQHDMYVKFKSLQNVASFQCSSVLIRLSDRNVAKLMERNLCAAFGIEVCNG